MKWLLVTWVVIVIYSDAISQDTVRHTLQMNGYIKDLQSLYFHENFTGLYTGNLIHHRHNLKWLPARKFTLGLEIRNRLFWGEEVATVPGFSQQLRNKNEALKLSWNLINSERIILNATIDRGWMQWNEKKWNVRIGRQRVNWGLGTIWNPNDLFNTFNFLDFDYEERPGIDGIKFQYATSSMNYIEATLSMTNQPSDIVAALKYFQNIGGYDLQFIGGLYQQQATIGIGWSGSIRETGFKGEVQYYFNSRKDEVNIVAEGDHVFSKGWYLNMALLFNSAGITTSGQLQELTQLQFSPKFLMPTQWNISLTSSKELSPLLTITTSAVYSPNTNLLILLPGITYGATDNMDISLIWQSFFMNQATAFDDLSHRCFLRIKWSY